MKAGVVESRLLCYDENCKHNEIKKNLPNRHKYCFFHENNNPSTEVVWFHGFHTKNRRQSSNDEPNNFRNFQKKRSILGSS